MDKLNFYLKKIQEDNLQEIEPASMAVITGAFYAASILNLAFNTYKKYFTKAARRCKDLPSKEKALCMLNAKIEGKKAELANIKGGISKCSKVKKEPKKCVEKLKKKSQKVLKNIQFLQNRLKELGKQKYKGD